MIPIRRCLRRLYPRASPDDSWGALIAAIRFLDALQNTLELICGQPHPGSLRYAHLPMLEGLRVLAVTGFGSYLVFYIERSSHVDVLRVLHGARDIPLALLDH
ncbi:MAG: type II toxin-antitoxin system RelE/ParE family toxin [Betaproteobacteria bacterium]|nr:type II toxin-antitoxin system RelE/ParE family toxin [Betaproteobacteria bacterium]